MIRNGVKNDQRGQIPGIVRPVLKNRSHHDRHKQHGDQRLDVAEHHGIAVSGDEVAQLRVFVLGHQRLRLAGRGPRHYANET